MEHEFLTWCSIVNTILSLYLSDKIGKVPVLIIFRSRITAEITSL